MISVFQQFLRTTPILLQADPQLAPQQFQSGGSLLWMFVQTVFALGFVCVLAYLVLRVALPRLHVTAGKTMVRVVDRTPLDPRRSLYVVEVTGRWLLIGASEGGLQLISELDPEAARQEAEAAKGAAATSRARVSLTHASNTARAAFADVLARMAQKRQ